ncbi:7-carboxy-7-deazaguanine synthase [Curvibacter sp. CHRR-16]|uniref:7-carboxy-7-deazaguanine synthase n=1 Tax=Curvibacter sp. CHRR-16 TaxID=2835872 RepID=UPI001BD988E9|nr:7-carboxy-7-deazaguanine synthase [Curvibacter sp. CHRR-16]MBT0571491.1 7-carboxy-7-deazaguanine synthase [Curvibacter sp. CHRR-16]
MAYSVKEIFYTLQGEGAHAGRPAVFCRFAGCNLWSGREEDRASAQCRFCDTDFVGTDGTAGGKYSSAQALAQAIAQHWPAGHNGQRFVVLTGGEPMLQIDPALVDALHSQGFYIAVETNGTLPATPGLDWVCVSPKAGTTIVQRQGHELKLVYPQDGIDPAECASWAFEHFRLQPLDTANPTLRQQHTQAAVDYCMAHPQWSLSLQTHKILAIR